MYKEEMDRLGFDEGGWFKKLATLGSLFGNVATPPKTEYELHSEQADKRYRNRPADREMFDVTTNYLMEQEDRNIQDAELMEELNTTAESWINAEPKQFIKNLIKYPMSKALIGAGKEDIEDLDKRAINYIMRSLDKIEDPTQRKLAERDIADYTSGDKKIPSLSSPIFDALRHGTLSYEFGNKLFARPALQAKERMQAVRASIRKEDPDTQKKDALNNLTAFRIKDANPNLTKEEFNQIFIDRFNESVRKVNNKEKLIPGIDFYLTAEDVKNMDKADIIRYPIGVDTPIFTTQEEADIYMDALPKATRSVVRGIIQGTVKYLGGTSLSSAFELSGRYQAMSPIYEKGLLSREDIEEYEQLPGFLETEAKHTRALGETVVPGDVDEESVWLSETATGLGILGVGIKQGVDLIRHYGPKAVTKLKNYFVKNPESTVDEAVKGVLGKAATRRDVIKGMGTGAVVAGTTSILGKIGMGAGAVGTTAKIASTVPLASATQVINRVPYHILKGSTVFKRHMTGSKNQIVGNKMFNADWTINEKVFDLAPIRVPSQTHRLSTKDLRTGDAYSKYGTWGEIDHIAIRDMPKLKPHFGDKFGLKPNEITTLDVRLQQTEIINPYDWVKGTRLNKRLDSGPGSGATRSKYENLTENLGLVWHENFDLIKLAKENPNKFRRVMDDVRKDKDMPRELIKYIDEVILSPDSTYLGTKNGMEFYQIKGVPMARNTVKELDREVVSFHQLSQFSNIYMPNMKGLERLRGKKFTAKELQELDDLTLSMYTSKFLPE